MLRIYLKLETHTFLTSQLRPYRSPLYELDQRSRYWRPGISDVRASHNATIAHIQSVVISGAGRENVAMRPLAGQMTQDIASRVP
jgi:hypothetical protein